jgi:N-sulfoglucosamine sulfohydrolase
MQRIYCMNANAAALRALSTLLLVCMLCALAPALAQQARPNIIWIVAEDVTAFTGAYGTRALKTPNLDQFTREGVRYANAYTTAGADAPSRAAIITGAYQTAIGAHHARANNSELPALGKEAPTTRPEGLPPYSAVLPDDVKAFPEYLRKAGYYTSNNQRADYQFEAPLTVWDESGPAASYRYRADGQPFFAVFNFFLTHESQIAMRKDVLLTEPGRLTVPPIYPDTPAVRADMARMFTNIELMDRQVGELIRQLKADGVYEQSVIFFFSDNGGGLPWMKREILERGTHIPLIVRLPGAARAGESNPELVSTVDLAPTVLSLAGIPIPPAMQGQSFLGEQRAAAPRQYVFAARDRMERAYDRVRTVRDKRYRYVLNYFPDRPSYQDITPSMALPMTKDILRRWNEKKLNIWQARWFLPRPIEELYDLDEDPWELRNLAGDPRQAEKLAELRMALEQWTRQYGDLGAVPEMDMLRHMWNGANEPPITATPRVIKANEGVRLVCDTKGASIAYRISTQGEAPPAAMHVVRSWDYEALLGDSVAGLAKNGDARPAPLAWKVYDGEVIHLKKGETLHVNAMRIGYRPALVDYADGKVLRSGR